jgi:hypothetical protein
LRPRAAALIAERSARGRPWGFKDPRTAVLLDFYDDLAPDARYLFVYRAPWEVVDSLLRTQERPLRGRAGVAVTMWVTYNASLLEFRERHPGRTALVHVDAVVHRPGEVVALAAPDVDDVGMDGAFVDDLMRRSDPTSPLAELLAADHPEAIALYERLEAAADIPSVEPTRRGSPPGIEVKPGGGTVAVSAVLAGAEAGGVDDAEFVARPTAEAAPATAADTAIDQVPGDLLAVVFEGQPRADALVAAIGALQEDPELGAVLLAAGDVLTPVCGHDPLTGADAAAAIVLRRRAWLATRGFAAAHPPEGFEAWTFAVACQAKGIRTARVGGGLVGVGRVARDEEIARLRVLERHPKLAARRALDAEVERDQIAGQLAQLRATRTWRLVTGWWRLRGRLRRRRRAD